MTAAHDLAARFQTALRDHKAGRLGQAERLYREILAIAPDHADSLHQLGVIAVQSGRLEAAADLLGQAAIGRDQNPIFHARLADVLRRLGRLDAAARSYEQALALAPDLLAAAQPLAAIRQGQERWDAAAAAYRAVLAIDPNRAEAWHNLGLVLQVLRQADQAVASFRAASTLQPTLAETHLSLAYLLRDRGDLAGAAASLERAIALRPDNAAAHYNLGEVSRGLGREAEAAAAYRRAIAVQPDLAEAHTSLANLLQAVGRLEDAETTYRAALALQPAGFDASMNLAKALHRQGRLGEAMAYFDQAARIAPERSEARDAWLCGLSYRADISAETLLAEHRRAGVGEVRSAPPRRWDNDCDPARRLRVGYVSGDLHHHPVGFFLLPVLAAHDRARVEVFCYSNGERIDAVTERLRAAADHWRAIAGLDDATTARRIADDGIDILIDLSGRTPFNRLALFAGRAAPVQASWLGYAATTGAPEMDYLLMDPVSAPPGAEAWCTEALVRLPHGRFCYGPPVDAPPPSIRRGPVTFGAFNNLSKIGPEVAALWSRVLRAVPGSRLVLKWESLADPGVRRRIESLFAEAGAPAGALEMRGFSAHPAMLAEYSEIDIALDPFPFCGGLTSCEAMWMGVPVVTLASDRFASRQTASFLHAVDLDALSARDPDDYVAIAVALAQDEPRRAALRASLRQRMIASPLCDASAFIPSLEAAYRQMWRRWCAGQAPAAFDVR